MLRLSTSWDSFLFGSGIALLSYVLEVFGEHALVSRRKFPALLALSIALLIGYWLHARAASFPLLRLKLFAIRTFRASVNTAASLRGSALGGVPFLLPLLYQTGLGFTPIQSGLLIMPQALGAMSIKAVIRRLLALIGYRGVLVSNTILIGILLMLFSTIGLNTPVWVILVLAYVYGGFTSLQYTSMNTLVYADMDERDTSSASTIASTMQQMSISFGVAAAGLTTAFFDANGRIACPHRGDDPWNPPCVPGAREPDHLVDHCVREPEERGWRRREPAEDYAPASSRRIRAIIRNCRETKRPTCTRQIGLNTL